LRKGIYQETKGLSGKVYLKVVFMGKKIGRPENLLVFVGPFLRRHKPMDGSEKTERLSAYYYCMSAGLNFLIKVKKLRGLLLKRMFLKFVNDSYAQAEIRRLCWFLA